MVSPALAFEHLLQCSSPELSAHPHMQPDLICSTADLRVAAVAGSQGRGLRKEWLWEVGCLDGTPVVKVHHDDATAEGEPEGDTAKLPVEERRKIGHGGKGPAEGAPCQYCAAFGIHSNADSWEVALGGVVGDEMAATGEKDEPKFAARLQKIRHWFEKDVPAE